jgi:hypothetical protein
MPSAPFGENAYCNSIREMLEKNECTKEEVAEALSTQPEFLAVIQNVIDFRNGPDWNPELIGCDLAEMVVGDLSREMIKAPWET